MKILISFYFFLYATFTFAQIDLSRTKITLREENLQGKVKQITQQQYLVKVVSGDTIIKKESSYPDGNLIQSYNQDGNKTTESHFYKLVDSTCPSIYFTYDKNKNLTELKMNISVNLFSRTLLKYNHQNKLIERDEYVENNILYRKYTYKYDQHGNRVEEVLFNPNGDENYKIQQVFDSIGNKTGAKQTNTKGQIEDNFSFAYFSNGLQSESISYNEDSSIFYDSHLEYDQSGNLLKESTMMPSDDSSITVTSYTYDAYSNPTNTTWHNSDGSVSSSFSYVYEYDAKGNWIKKTFFIFEKITTIQTREISYY